MYDKSQRGAATRGNYISCAAGEGMCFQITKVHPLRMTQGAPNGDYQCSPHDVEVHWRRDAKGNYEQPEEGGGGRVWDPPASKLDGLIELADELAELTGNDAELLNHVIELDVVEEQNPATKRWYNVYKFTLPNGLPQAGARTAAPPARGGPPAPRGTTPAAPPPRGGPPAPPAPRGTTPPAPPARGGPPAPRGAVQQPAPATIDGGPALAEFDAACATCNTLGELKEKVRQFWPRFTAARVTVDATAIASKHKIEIATGLIGNTQTQEELDQVWNEVSPELQRDPAQLKIITKAYTDHSSALAGGPAAGGEDDIPF